jgi:hypothetical protein
MEQLRKSLVTVVIAADRAQGNDTPDLKMAVWLHVCDVLYVYMFRFRCILSDETAATIALKACLRLLLLVTRAAGLDMLHVGRAESG